MKEIINQIYEIQRKASDNNLSLFERNFERLTFEFEKMGYFIVIPINQVFDDADMSVEATILSQKLNIITKVIKPTIYKKEKENLTLIQKGIVIVE
jgi:hypothetical protein